MIAVNDEKHIVLIKGAKDERGTLFLMIRDSAKDPTNSNEIWIENRVTHHRPNQMTLSLSFCVYFTLS